MQKWEYLFEQTETAKQVDAILAKAGSDGWELVSVTMLPSKKTTSGPALMMVDICYWNFFFKRPLSQ